MNDPDGTSPNETPAGETSAEQPSPPDSDRDLSAGGPGTEEKGRSATPETDFDWSPHPSVSELPEVQDDTNPSYGRIRDRLLQNRPFQFSLATMFWITAAVAIVFSSARASGKPYDECLTEMLLWIYIPFVAPAVIVLVSSYAKTEETILLVGGVTAAVMLAPGLILAGCLGGSDGIISVLSTTVFIWGFEAVVILGIWRGLDWMAKSQSRTKNRRKQEAATPEIEWGWVRNPREPVTDPPDSDGESVKPLREQLPSESNAEAKDLPRIVDASPAMDKLRCSGCKGSQPLTSPLQFSLWNLLMLTAAVAILFSFAKASGAGFGTFFLWLYLLVVFFGPYPIFLIAASWPRVQHENRKWIGVVVALLILGSMAVVTGYLAVTEGMPIDAILSGIGLLVLVWGPQVLVLWMIFHWRPICGDRFAAKTAPAGSIDCDSEHGSPDSRDSEHDVQPVRTTLNSE